MKIPKSLMQEIEAGRYGETADEIINNISVIVKRRLEPFTPEILLEYGFEKEVLLHGIYYNMKVKKKDLDIVIDKLAINIQYDSGKFVAELNLTFPLWETIDEFENDLSRVMESLK